MLNNFGFKDDLGRRISYLRLSITDRCNLRCFYCKSRMNYKHIPHDQILRYEECLTLIHLSKFLGVQKVRLTGGEPFKRKDILWFLEQIYKNFPEIDLRITTNGTLIKDRIKDLKNIGLTHLNISLDTLQREKFVNITGQDYFNRVRAAIDECLARGIRVKVNVVAMQGINDDELKQFVNFALGNNLDLRFIEFMPVGNDSVWEKKLFWHTDDIVNQIQNITPLEPIKSSEKNHGPARMFNLPQGAGRIGVISPLSNHFCESCNRFRITSNGRLRICLFSDKEYNLLPVLRNPKCSRENLLQTMKRAVKKKPMGYKLYNSTSYQNCFCNGKMNYIGG